MTNMNLEKKSTLGTEQGVAQNTPATPATPADQEVPRMTISRALTRLKVIKAQLGNCGAEIAKYAYGTSKDYTNIGPAKSTQRIFENHKETARYVASQFQKYQDLVAEALKIKKAIDLANGETYLTIRRRTFTIDQWLYFLQEIAPGLSLLSQQIAKAESNVQYRVDAYNETLARKDVSTADLEVLRSSLVYFISREATDDLKSFITDHQVEVMASIKEKNNTVYIEYPDSEMNQTKTDQK